MWRQTAARVSIWLVEPFGSPPDDPEALATGAFALGYFGEEIDVAIAWIDRSLTLNPSFAHGWVWSAVLRNWAGQPSLAIEHFNTSLRLSPRSNRRVQPPFGYLSVLQQAVRRGCSSAARVAGASSELYGDLKLPRFRGVLASLGAACTRGAPYVSHELVDGADLLRQRRVRDGGRRWRATPPRMKAGHRHADHARHHGNRKDGLVRAHEFEDPGGIAPVSRANQAAARERMSALQPQLLVLTPQSGQFLALSRRKPVARRAGKR